MDRLTVNDLRPCMHGKSCKHVGSCTSSSTLFNDMNKNPHKYYNVIEEDRQVLDCGDLYEPSEETAPEVAGYQAKDCGSYYRAYPSHMLKQCQEDLQSIPPEGSIKPAGQIASEERANLKMRINNFITTIETRICNDYTRSDEKAELYQAKATALLALATLATKGD